MVWDEEAPHSLAEEIRHLFVVDRRIAWRAAIGLWMIALSLFALVAIPASRSAIDRLDLEVYEAIFPFKVGILTFFAYVLNFLGSSWFVWPLRFVVTAWLAVRKRWSALAVWWIAIVVSEPAIGILKLAYDRPRPPESLVDTFSASFPSGHAVVGAVVAIGLVIVFVPAGPRRRNLEVLAGMFALLMAGSRVYLGAHWLTDVVAGTAFGAACAIASAAAVHWFVEHRPHHRHVDKVGDASSIR